MITTQKDGIYTAIRVTVDELVELLDLDWDCLSKKERLGIGRAKEGLLKILPKEYK